MTLLVVDGNNVAKRAQFTVRDLTNKHGVPTGIVRGFVSILQADMRAVGADRIYVFFDHDAKSDKHVYYPEYKATRERSPEPDFHAQVLTLRRLLPTAGVRVYRKRGIEGDEVGATLAYQYAKTFKQDVYIASNDKDFASLVSKRIKLLKPKQVVWGRDEIIENFGVPPEKFVEYLMLLGDKVDNIPGVDKCGPKTAAKWLADVDSVNDIKGLTGALADNFKAAKKHFPLTRRLIELNVSHDLPLLEPKFDLKKCAEICRELDMHSTLNHLKSIASKLR